jgi:hypothetical protein
MLPDQTGHGAKVLAPGPANCGKGRGGNERASVGMGSPFGLKQPAGVGLKIGTKSPVSENDVFA